MLDFSIVYHVSTGENPAFYQEIMELRAKAILRRILVNTKYFQYFIFILRYKYVL